MLYGSADIPSGRRRATRPLWAAVLGVLACHGVAAAICTNLDPAEIERFRKLAAEQAANEPTPVPPATTQDLAEALRKARSPLADVVAAHPGAVEEWPLDFLGDGVFIRATLDDGYRSRVLHFVRQGKRIIPIERGREGRARIQRDVRLSVRDGDAAVRYLQWLLDVTTEGGIWLVKSPDEVPFILTKKEDVDLNAKIGAARQDLAGKIQPPSVDASGPGFVVRQDAVVGRDLVRYTAKVSKLGLTTVEQATLAKDLPVSNLLAAQ